MKKWISLQQPTFCLLASLHYIQILSSVAQKLMFVQSENCSVQFPFPLPFCLIFKNRSILHNLLILEFVFAWCFQLIFSLHSLASRSFFHKKRSFFFSSFHCFFSYESVNVSICCHLSTLFSFLPLPPFILLYHFPLWLCHYLL